MLTLWDHHLEDPELIDGHLSYAELVLDIREFRLSIRKGPRWESNLAYCQEC